MPKRKRDKQQTVDEILEEAKRIYDHFMKNPTSDPEYERLRASEIREKMFNIYETVDSLLREEEEGGKIRCKKRTLKKRR